MNKLIRPKGYLWVVIALLFFLTVISNADKAIIGFAAKPIMDELSLSPEQWGLVGSSFYFLFSISAILVGILADRVGLKKTIAGMAILWAIIQFSTIFVTSYSWLLVTRIILGAGEGPAYGLAMAAASRVLPKEKLGIGLTMVSIGGPLGIAISAPFLISLITNFGWRAGFITTGIVGVILVITWLIVINEEDLKTKQVVNEEIKEGIEGEGESVSFTKSLISKNFLVIAFCGFVAYWSLNIGTAWLPNYFESIRQLPAATLSLVISIPWIVITISQIIFSSISDQRFKKTRSFVKSRVFVLGPVLIGGGIFYLLGTLFDSNWLTIAFLSLGLGLGAIPLVLGPAILIEITPRKHIAKMQGTFMAVASIGGIIAPYITGILVGSLATEKLGFHTSFQFTALLLMFSGSLVCLFVRQRQEKKEIEFLPADKTVPE